MSRDLTIFELDTTGDRTQKNVYVETIGFESDASGRQWICRKFSTESMLSLELSLYRYVQFMAPDHLPEMRKITGEEDEWVGSAWLYDPHNTICNIASFSGFSFESWEISGAADLLPILFFLDQSMPLYMTPSGKLMLHEFDFSNEKEFMLSRSTVLSNMMSRLQSPKLIESRDFKKRSFLSFLKIILLPRTFLDSIFHDEEREEFLFDRKMLLEEKLHRDDVYGAVLFQITAAELITFFENFHQQSSEYFHFDSDEEKHIYLKTVFVRYLNFCMQFLADKIEGVIDQISWYLECVTGETILSDINREKCSELFLILALRDFLMHLVLEVRSGCVEWEALNGILKKMQLVEELYSNISIIESSQLHESCGMIARLKKITRMIYVQLAVHAHFFKPILVSEEEKKMTSVHVKKFTIARLHAAFFEWLSKTRERNRVDILVNHARIIFLFDFSCAEIKKNTAVVCDETAVSALRESLLAAKSAEAICDWIQKILMIHEANLLQFKQYFFQLLCDFMFREMRLKEDLFFILENAMSVNATMRYFAGAHFFKCDEEEIRACQLLVKLYPTGKRNSQSPMPPYFAEIEDRRQIRETNKEGGWVCVNATPEVSRDSSRFRFSLEVMKSAGNTASVLAVDAASVAGNVASHAATTAATFVSGWMPSSFNFKR